MLKLSNDVGVIGDVSYLSPDSCGYEVPQDWRITVHGELVNVGKGFRLIPGMEATAEINAGKRALIDSLIDPLIKALDESGKEP